MGNINNIPEKQSLPLNRKKSDLIVLSIIGAIVIIGIIFSVVFYFVTKPKEAQEKKAELSAIEQAQLKAKDKQIMNAISQIANQEADEYDSNNVYTDANGSGPSTLDKLLQGIKTAGSATASENMIILSANASEFSIHAQLMLDKTYYFCMDSTGFADYVRGSNDPITGPYCTEPELRYEDVYPTTTPYVTPNSTPIYTPRTTP